MTHAQASTYCDGIRGRFDAPFSDSDKSLIEKMYTEVLGKTFHPTSCQNCYHDAFIEIYKHLKTNKTMANELKYHLKAGAVIACPDFHNGEIYSNSNLTDKIAAEYLKKYPSRACLFDRIPEEKAENEEKAAETAETPVKRAKK